MRRLWEKASRLTLGDLRSPRGDPRSGPVTVRDGSGEVSRGQSSRSRGEGPNPLVQGADRKGSRDMEQQQGRMRQLDFLKELEASVLGHDRRGGGGTAARRSEERQMPTAPDRKRALTFDLMTRIACPGNLLRAAARVKANQGAAGADGMNVRQLGTWLGTHMEALIADLREGRYRPQPVLGVEIPKPGGGKRQLGVPTVIDRLVQQAILQILEPILEATFSPSSFGFRPGRGAHDALRQASAYVAGGREIVVDLDVEKFFDRVNHDVLLARLARHIADKTLLRIVRRFLEAGMMKDGVCVRRVEGTPQGGPLSPLLANLLLDDLDKELERRGHAFCRYADDCNIYVRTLAAGERVMASVSRFLERRLRLRVNRRKSAVAPVSKRKFLGYRLGAAGRLSVAPESVKRVKERIRAITRGTRGVSLARVISDLNGTLPGWVTYFRLTGTDYVFRDLDKWVRRRLRSLRLRQCRNPRTIAQCLRSLGVPDRRARQLSSSGKGWWRLAASPPVHAGMTVKWFKSLGLLSLADRYATLQH